MKIDDMLATLAALVFLFLVAGALALLTPPDDDDGGGDEPNQPMPPEHEPEVKTALAGGGQNVGA